MRNWKDYQGVEQSADPQSLLGYGRAVYETCEGQCMYCGLGAKDGPEPDTQYDIWRQLTVEHIVPESWWPAANVVDSAIQRCVAATDQEAISLRKALEDLNLVTACHNCNSLTSRYPSKDQEGSVMSFWGTALGFEPKVSYEPRGKRTLSWLQPLALAKSTRTATRLNEVQWLGRVCEALLRVWQDKQDAARKKICGQRQGYRLFASAVRLVDPSPVRQKVSPAELDSKVEKIIRGNCVHKRRDDIRAGR